MTDATPGPDRRTTIAVLAALVAGGGLVFAWAYTLLGSCLRYGIWELFTCGYTGWAAAVGNAAAAAGCAALAFCAVRPSCTEERVLRAVGMGSGVIAAAAAIALPIAPVDQVWRVALVGWIGIGSWLVGLSIRRSSTTESLLGGILGGTLIAWGILNLRNDDPVPIIGGTLFFLPFMIWTWRLASRLTTGWRPGAVSTRPASLRIASEIVVGIAVVFIVLPVWVVSTFGGTILGDPIQPFEVRNETQAVITFFHMRGQLASGMYVQPRETKSTGMFPRSRYAFAATEGDREIWCGMYTSADLKRARFVVIVTNDVASCN